MIAATSLLALAFAAASGLAAPLDVPAGYKIVYITSNVNAKFVVQPKAAKAGSAVVVQTLTSKPEQQWYVKDGASKIQLAGTTLCLDAGAKFAARAKAANSPPLHASQYASADVVALCSPAKWKDMAALVINDCADTAEGQNFDIKADGRIAVAASSPQECVDLQYMRATANNPVGLYSCAGLGNAGAGDKGINWPLVAAT
ncbi:uncharacterized protein SPSK_06629 [Sporothrix schenckii 1099-18]|uniref:Uncharacterized protein n=1 Tax=Sporothrix schenckii 1099-18 TaxID=1397361 RepID=A0A0F2MJK2_SPOSC|nr:uncharacterized protein SPSK_06629 [Sporothrix schenckii 1099-18]KJR89244.1 hypothetical protein SPSK_06629 [Sporothrix schenckii 1099-18]